MHGPVADQQRCGVPGVDGGEDSGGQLQPAQKPGDEGRTSRGVGDDCLVRGLRLVEQGGAAAAGVA